MKKERLIRNKKSIYKEFIVLIITVIVLFIGIGLDFSNYILIEIESDKIFSLCSIIITSQIAITGIIYSLITINANFQNNQKYGVRILEYLMLYKYYFLNQKNILIIEMILLLASFCFFIIEWVNTVFCIFLCSLLFLFFLSLDVFELYRNDKIDNYVFCFVRDNLRNKKLNLLYLYCESERTNINSYEKNGKIPSGRLEELWNNELNTINDDSYQEIHSAFVSLVNCYISSENEQIQDYGLKIANNILEKIIKLKQPKPKVDNFGQISDSITKYGLELINNLMPQIVKLFYTKKTWILINSFIYLLIHFDDGKDNYSCNKAINVFFNSVVESSENTDKDNERLENLIESFLICFPSGTTLEDILLHPLIHLSLTIVKHGNINIINNSFFVKRHIYYDNHEEQLLYIVIICYLFYMAYFVDDGTIISNNLKELLHNNIYEISNIFLYLKLNDAFRVDIHNWLKNYEIKGPFSKYSKEPIIDYAIDHCLILYKSLSCQNNFEWLADLLNKDWLRYYNIVNHERFHDNFYIVGKQLNIDDDTLDFLFSNLNKSLNLESINAEIKICNSIDEAILEEKLTKKISKLKETLSFGVIPNIQEKTKLTVYLIYKKCNDSEQFVNSYLSSINELCQKTILKYLYSKDLEKIEINNCFDIERYLEKVKTCDIHYGLFGVLKILKDNLEFAKRLHNAFHHGYPCYLEDDTSKICFDADSKYFGFIAENFVVQIRKLNENEQSNFFPNIEGNKHKVCVVNEIFFSLDDDEFNRYVDSTTRVIEVSFDVSFLSCNNSGFFSKFNFNK